MVLCCAKDITCRTVFSSGAMLMIGFSNWDMCCSKNGRGKRRTLMPAKTRPVRPVRWSALALLIQRVSSALVRFRASCSFCRWRPRDNQQYHVGSVLCMFEMFFAKLKAEARRCSTYTLVRYERI